MNVLSTTSGRAARLTVLLTLTAAVVACGGSGGSESVAPPVTPPPPPPVSDADRQAAAEQTATTNAACTSLTAFYWEVGDTTGVRASGQAGSGAPGADTQMAIASASKWIFAAYALQKKGSAALSETDDVPFLNFTSGYSGFVVPTCPGVSGTVDDCLVGSRGERNLVEAVNGTYDYNSGHMEKYASLIGLGPLQADALATEILRLLAPAKDWTLSYDDVQLAGSVRTSASQYRVFLQKMLGSSPALRIADELGTHAVCTLKSATCTNTNYSPSPLDWHYSLGHWVEDDQPTIDADNEAYSSAGAYGFYPWVNKDRSLYGILAREEKADETDQRGFKSASCGQLIRKAFVTATAQ